MLPCLLTRLLDLESMQLAGLDVNGIMTCLAILHTPNIMNMALCHRKVPQIQSDLGLGAKGPGLAFCVLFFNHFYLPLTRFLATTLYWEQRKRKEIALYACTRESKYIACAVLAHLH
ncbi:hypothetical protein ACJX0J_031468 [Zea mays]